MITVIERIRKIQNKTKNLGWGISEYSPRMNLNAVDRTKSQWVIVVGHNVYRKTITMFLESFTNGNYSLSLITKTSKVGDYVCDEVNEDELIAALCYTLKKWFPEISVGGVENAK